MDTNTTGCNQLFSDYKRGTPLYKYMWVAFIGLMLAAVAVLAYGGYNAFTWYETKDVLEKALKAADVLDTLIICGVVGGIILGISAACRPYDYTIVMCSMWIKKNNVDYKKYLGDSGANMTGKEHRVLLATYMSAFPQVQKREMIKLAIGMGAKAIGAVLLCIGLAKMEAAAVELIESGISGLVLMGVGMVLYMVLDMVYIVDPDKQKRLAWKEQVIKESAQN